MFDRLLPLQADNAYRGAFAALWLLGLLVAAKAAMGLNVVHNGRRVAVEADGIPLDTFTPGGRQTVLALFAAWGLGQVVLAALGAIVLVRYRALVPLVFSLFLAEHLGRKLVFQVIPIVRAGSPPGFWVNLVLLALMLAGFVLSLFGRTPVAT